MKLKTKLILVFSSLVILLLATGAMGFYSVNRASQSAESFKEKVLYLDLVGRLQLTIERSLMPPHDYLIHGNPTEREIFSLVTEQADRMIETLIRMDLIGIGEEERALVNETKTSFANLKQKALRILNDEVESDDTAVFMEGLDAFNDNTIRKIDMLNQLAYEKVATAVQQEQLYRRRLNLLLFTCAALFVIDAAVSSLFIWRSISTPLWFLQEGVRTISDGKLDHRVSVKTGGEFKELVDTFNGMVEGFQGSFSDLEAENDRLHTLLFNIDEGVLVADANYDLLFMNPVAEEIFGKQYDELRGRDVLGCHKRNDWLKKVLKENNLPVATKVNYASRILCVSAASIKKRDGTKIGYLMIVRDITSQEKVRERAEELAITNGLTKIYNYSYFQHSLEYEFSKAQRYNLPLSVIMIDIDHFKSFNDKHGHQTGDIVLVTLAKLLKKTIRKIDVAARYGGEEFVVILPHTEENESQLLAERLREKTETHVIKSMMGHPISVTISLGVATFANNNFKHKDELIKSADDALYKAKKSGRNRVEVSLS